MGSEVDMVSLSGAIGTLLSTTLLYPLDTCKTRYQGDVRPHAQLRTRNPRNPSDVLFKAISSHRFLSLYQGLGTKNLQSFIAQFVYFYGYNYFKRVYLKKIGSKTVRTKANLILATAAGACTAMLRALEYGICKDAGKRVWEVKGAMGNSYQRVFTYPVRS